MTQKVFIEPLWNIRGVLRSFVDWPPDGYEFSSVPRPTQPLTSNIFFRWSLMYRIAQLANTIVPYVLLMSWLQKWRKPPRGTALTYGFGHVVFRPEPWVVEVEYASLLVGSYSHQLNQFRRVLESALASRHCKSIICWSEAGRRTIVDGLKSEKFRHKAEVVHSAVPQKSFIKDYAVKKNTKLLFVGSQSSNRPFETYGGVELLRAFALLRQKYEGLEMVVRSPMPANLKAQFGSMGGLRIIDQVVPWETLEREFQSADICVLPYHTTSPHTILEAMSYELPVVGRDCWANPEYILDGITGLLAQPSQKVPYYCGDTCHPSFPTAEFQKAIKEPAPEVVDELAWKLSLLIENPELRRKLGKAGRWEVEHGKFSTGTRNAKLKKIFDHAISPDD